MEASTRVFDSNVGVRIGFNAFQGTCGERFDRRRGCEPRYDKSPREKGDGCSFYDYSVKKDDKTFILTKMLPAIERQLKDEMDSNDLENMLICRDFITKRYLNGELD